MKRWALGTIAFVWVVQLATAGDALESRLINLTILTALIAVVWWLATRRKR